MKRAPRHGFHSITPRVVVADAAGMVAFLKIVFGASGEHHQARPSEILIGDSLVMVTQARERDAFPAFLYVYVDDADVAHARAVEAGAVSLEAPLDLPYGDRRAMVRDPFGNVWQLAHVIARQRVLVVEDDPASRRLVKAVIELHGHEALRADSVEVALAMLASDAPELVITDISLPGGGGPAVLAAIRAEASRAHLPVIASTAHALRSDREKYLAMGFDGYAPKPVDITALGELIDTLLRPPATD